MAVMRYGFLIVVFLMVGAFQDAGWAVGMAEPNDPNGSARLTKVAVISLKGDVDWGLYESLRRRSERAIHAGAEYLIYEVETYGGMVDAADAIAKYFIQTLHGRAHTVAYISTEAISAGSMISVSCNDIIMRENTTIGDCAPITLGAKLEGVEREKAESFIRAVFRRAAEANGYPKVLLEAMVSVQMEVWRVKNLQTGQWEYFEAAEKPKDPNVYDVANAQQIDKPDSLLTLTASQALEYGVARAVVKDVDEAMAFLEHRDGVRFVRPPMVLKTMWSEEMVRWLNSSAVMGVLVGLAMLGVYVEFTTPGVMLPGLVAAVCFVIIVGSRYLTGLANWVEILVLLAGLALLMIEVFVIPGFGIAGILGIILVLAGLFGMLVHNGPGEFPWPQTPEAWQTFVNGAAGLSLGFLAFIVVAAFGAKYLPRIPVANRLMLAAPNESPAVRMGGTGASAPEPPVKVGQQGVSVTQLHPAGIARFGTERLSVVSQGGLIEANRQIVVAEIAGNSVVVKEATGSKKTA
jgi:membrane-bound serine protease (ClpP class)